MILLDTEKKWVTLFTVIHLVIFCVVTDIFTNKIGLMALYGLNMFMLIQQMTTEKQMPKTPKRPPVTRPKNLMVKDESNSMDITLSINLFINRWKQVHLYQPPTFPLDRLAYLSAKYYAYNTRHLIFLPNPQMKSLAKRQVQPNMEDSVHPLKMVTNFLATYIHERSVFYRRSNMYSVEKRQYTKAAMSDQDLPLKLLVSSDCVLYPKKIGLKEEFDQPEFGLLPGEDTLSSVYKKEEEEKGFFKKLSDLYDHIVGIKLKKFSKTQILTKDVKKEKSDKDQLGTEELDDSGISET